ncbi:MAG: hypothetical protein ACLTGG_07865 [Subdoligranulum sp.]
MAHFKTVTAVKQASISDLEEVRASATPRRRTFIMLRQ